MYLYVGNVYSLTIQSGQQPRTVVVTGRDETVPPVCCCCWTTRVGQSFLIPTIWHSRRHGVTPCASMRDTRRGAVYTDVHVCMAPLRTRQPTHPKYTMRIKAWHSADDANALGQARSNILCCQGVSSSASASTLPVLALVCRVCCHHQRDHVKQIER